MRRWGQVSPSIRSRLFCIESCGGEIANKKCAKIIKIPSLCKTQANTTRTMHSRAFVLFAVSGIRVWAITGKGLTKSSKCVIILPSFLLAHDFAHRRFLPLPIPLQILFLLCMCFFFRASNSLFCLVLFFYAPLCTFHSYSECTESSTPPRPVAQHRGEGGVLLLVLFLVMTYWVGWYSSCTT